MRAGGAEEVHCQDHKALLGRDQGWEYGIEYERIAMVAIAGLGVLGEPIAGPGGKDGGHQLPRRSQLQQVTTRSGYI